MKPTPGQWTAIWSESFARWVIYDSVSRVVCQVVPDDYREQDPTAPTHQNTNRANAVILAAAPQLQDALHDLFLVFSGVRSGDVGTRHAECDAAFEKAIEALRASRSTGWILPIVHQRPVTASATEPSHQPTA